MTFANRPLVLIRKLQDFGAEVHYSDPHVSALRAGIAGANAMCGAALGSGRVAMYDLVLLATDHAKFDFAMIKQHARLIVGTRGIFSSGLDKVVKG
jgi:UDP-N-acetyl-D-glucosamine dehydrogenase